jgi:enoyl-CoA hydratase/carnithine racemase
VFVRCTRRFEEKATRTMPNPFELPPTIELEMRDDIAVLHLNRAEKRNAIDLSIIDGLRTFFAALDESLVKSVVICGRGDNFSAGLDLSELRESDPAEGMLHSLKHHESFREVQYARVPVIAVLHGAVIGAGLELASSVHIRVAEASAYYALPEGRRGIFLGGGGSVRISRLIGVARVTDMMMTGRTYDAQEGYQFGISQYLVPEGEGVAKGVEVARSAATNAPLSNFAMIQALPRIIEMGPEEGLFAEALMVGIAQGSDEAKERLRAFLEKRAAKVSRAKT